MAQITNVVLTANLGSTLDLNLIARRATFIRYQPKKFSGAIWQHRKIGSTCLVFRTGKVVCIGAKSIEEGRKGVRQYARLLQNMGHYIHLKDICIQTMSAVYTTQARLIPEQLVTYLGATYKPELMMAAMLKRQCIHFTCFPSGKVIIAGVKKMVDLDEVVLPTLMELEVI